MLKKELRSMNRLELLERLLQVMNENEALRRELRELKRDPGSPAEPAPVQLEAQTPESADVVELREICRAHGQVLRELDPLYETIRAQLRKDTAGPEEKIL